MPESNGEMWADSCITQNTFDVSRSNFLNRMDARDSAQIRSSYAGSSTSTDFVFLGTCWAAFVVQCAPLHVANGAWICQEDLQVTLNTRCMKDDKRLNGKRCCPSILTQVAITSTLQLSYTLQSSSQETSKDQWQCVLSRHSPSLKPEIATDASWLVTRWFDVTQRQLPSSHH